MESVQRHTVEMMEPASKHEDDHEHEHGVERADLVRIGVVVVAAMLTWFQVWQPVAKVDVLGLVAALVGGYPIYREAYEALREKRMTMELSMTIAIVAALAIGEVFTALVIIVFVLVAEILEGLTVGRGRRAIQALLDVLPREVTVKRGRTDEQVHITSLVVEDIVVVKPGGRLPVDGVVISGHSFVDQATITGESMPVEKVPGSAVYAGTMNQSGALEVRTTSIGHDTAFGRIVEAVERAEKSRAPIQKTADRLAGYLVYFALGCAAFTLLLTRDARATISVIIVAGACGIAAGTPLAVLGAIGRAARLGAIIKGGLYLEALGDVDTVVVDKTGTMTVGNPEVVAVRAAPGVEERVLLETAAIAERRSEHPLAGAVLKRFGGGVEALPLLDTFEYLPGRGIVGSLDGDAVLVGNRALFQDRAVAVAEALGAEDSVSEILVSRGGRVLGALAVADVLRPEAVDAVGRLRRMGLRVTLLTGDAASIANAVGKKLAVDEVRAELMPEEKEAYVKKLRGMGRKVVTLGDGINDAPALVQANVGVAMGSGTDVARESANVVLIGNDLAKFVETIHIARWCRSIIRQNFVGTLVVDGVGVLLAAFGVLNPLIAAFIHVSSELVFILNSTRLLPRVRRS